MVCISEIHGAGCAPSRQAVMGRLWRGGKGTIFADRFHLEILDNPTRARNLLNYVLRNDVHHGLKLRGLAPHKGAAPPNPPPLPPPSLVRPPDVQPYTANAREPRD